MTSADLKDVYLMIPVVSEQRKHLRFQWERELYQSCCIPFRLSSALRKFSKVLKPPDVSLKREGP